MDNNILKKIKNDEKYGFLYGKLLSSRVCPEFFDIKNNEKIINIGCGNGPQAIVYASNYKEMIGVDVNKERIEQSIKIMDKFGIDNYKPMYGNVEKLPFASNDFDISLAVDIIEHVQNPKKMCEEIYRVLKDDGEVLITFPATHDKFVDFASWVGRVFFQKKKKEKRSGWDPDNHNNEFSLERWIKLVEDSGFRLKRSRATTMFPPLHLYGVHRFWYSNNFIHKIDSFFCKLPFIKKCGQTLLCVFIKKK